MDAPKRDLEPAHKTGAALRSHSPRHHQMHNWAAVVPEFSCLDFVGMPVHSLPAASVEDRG